MMKRLLLTGVALWVGTAFGHAHLSDSNPVAGSILEAAPAQVELSFSEPVETMFSIFKVWRLDTTVDLAEENAEQRLNGLAGALVNEVLELDASAEELLNQSGLERVDTALESSGATVAELNLLLQDDLPDGHYVLMWRVLSIDTHVTQGFVVFSVLTGE